MTRTTRWLLIGGVALALLVAMSALGNSFAHDPAGSRAADRTDTMAVLMCQKQVASRLGSATGATFQGAGAAEVTHPDGAFRVWSYVDVPGAAGPQRKRFTCTIDSADGATWTLRDLLLS